MTESPHDSEKSASADQATSSSGESRTSVIRRTGDGVVAQLWRHPWGRILMAAMTVAVVFWALRETAYLTGPLFTAIQEILIPLAIGFTIAYILSPIVDRLGKWGIPRSIGTTILFICMSFIGVLFMVLLLPSVVRQGGDLGKRIFIEQYYVDMDGDERFSQGDIRVQAIPEEPGFYVESLELSSAPRFQRDKDRVLLETSLIAQLGTWMEQQTGPLRRAIGMPLDEAAQRELAFYASEQRQIIDLLDQGLTDISDEATLNVWLAQVAQLTEQAGLDGSQETLSLDAIRWPGVTPADVAAAQAGLDESLQARWQAAMRQGIQVYFAQHDLSIAAIERARGGAGVDNELVASLRVIQRQALSEEERQRIQRLYERLSRSEGAEQGAYAAYLLGTVFAAQPAGNNLVQDVAGRVNVIIGDELDNATTTIGNWLKGVLSNLPALLSFGLNTVLVPIYAFFLILALPQLRTSTRTLALRYGSERWLLCIRRIERVVAAFFRGRLIVCALCGALFYLGFALLQVPYAALFAFLIGLATAIPLAGLLFIVPAGLLVLLDGGDSVAMRVGLLAGLYAVIQTLEATVLTPMIMGREVELHPVLLILALLFFGQLFGVLGLILAVPIAATIRILYQEFWAVRIHKWMLARKRRPEPAACSETTES